MNFVEQKESLRKQLNQVESQLAQLVSAKCRIEGALAVIDQHLLDEAAISKATAETLGVAAPAEPSASPAEPTIP